MTVSDKIKTSNKKIEQNKAQYNLDRKVLKFWFYHQEMLINMNFSLAKMFYQRNTCQKKLLQSRFENSPLGSELKKQTDIAKKSIKNWTRFMNLIKRKR